MPEAVGASLAFARARFDTSNGDEPEPSFHVEDSTAIVSVQGPLYQRAVSFCGMMVVDGYDAIESRARAAFAADDVDSVLLDIDSPGGDAAGISELVSILRSLSAETGKPLHARASELMASAAYWLGSAAQSISAPRTGQIGSIGVIVMGLNRHGEIAAKGQRVIVAASPPGKLLAASTMLDPANASNMADLAVRLQGRVEELQAIFTGDVAKARGLAPETIFGFNAATFGGEAALKNGLVDHVESRAETMDRIRKGSKRKVYSMGETDSGASAQVAAKQAELSEEHKRLIALGTSVEAMTGQKGEAATALVASFKEASTLIPTLARRVKVEALRGRLASHYPPSQSFAIGLSGLPDPAAGLHPDFEGMSLAVFDARTSTALPHAATSAPPSPQASISAPLTQTEKDECKARGVDPDLYAKNKARLYNGAVNA